MSKTIEFVEKEIKNIKELLELDDVLCLQTDEDYKFWYDRLQTLEQIKCELEAWEVVKPAISEEHLEDCQIRIMYGENPFMNVSKEETTKVKKALEVEDE